MPIDFGSYWWENTHMTTLVTADDKGRISIRGSQPGRKYVVSQIGTEWRVTPYAAEGRASRNRREWSGGKGKKSLLNQIKTMGGLGLGIEKSELKSVEESSLSQKEKRGGNWR